MISGVMWHDIVCGSCLHGLVAMFAGCSVLWEPESGTDSGADVTINSTLIYFLNLRNRRFIQNHF